MSKEWIDLPGKHWKPIVNLHNAVMGENEFTNYRTKIADRYFFDITGYWNKYNCKADNETDIKIFHDEIEKLGVDIDISDTLFGNPPAININDKIITHDLVLTCEEIDFVNQHIDFNKIGSVVEIGGGYGRTAYGILMKYPHIQYKIVDIEPALTIAHYHLNKSLSNCNVEFIKPSECENIEDVDLWLSISTMAELDYNQVMWYVENISRTGKHFYIKDRHIYDGKNLCEQFIIWDRIASQASRSSNYMIDEIYLVKKND
jgi:hypothetical protein